MAATYDQLVDWLIKNAPGAADLIDQNGSFTPQFNDYYNLVFQTLADKQGVGRAEDIDLTIVSPQDIAAVATPTPTGTNQNVPLEQGLLNAALPNLAAQVNADAGRQAQVQNFTNQTNAAFGNVRDVLGQAASTFDGAGYLRANPDLAAEYQKQLADGSLPKGANGQPMTPDEWAKLHYDTYGKNEGRQGANFTSQLTQSQIANANDAAGSQTAAASAAASAQLAALQTSIGQMQGNLQGALGQQAAALAQQVASLNQNLDTLSASQKQILADQIKATQQNLEQSIAAQKAALAQQILELQGNASAAAQSKKVALEQQVAELTAAQEPMNQARLQAAEGLVTAVNLGLENTRDQLTATNAQNGYIGGSTAQDAALVRATVGARQDAANIVGGAKVANASDTRDIARVGAGGRFSIADALANQTQHIGDYGANGKFGLSTGLATGTQAINDYGAAQAAANANKAAQDKAGIGAYGANTTYANTNAGIGAGLDLSNQGAAGQYSIAAALAQQQQQIANQQAAAKQAAANGTFSNALNAAQIGTQLPGANAAANAALIPYGNAGLTNAQNALSWWNTGATPPGSTAVTTAPDQTGNGIANLGAGLLGGAFQIGNSADWWKTPTPTTTTKTGTNTSTKTSPWTWSTGWSPKE